GVYREVEKLPVRARRECRNSVEGLANRLGPDLLEQVSLHRAAPDQAAVKLQRVHAGAVLTHEGAILAVARREFQKRRRGETGLIPRRHHEAESFDEVSRRNEDINVRTDAEGRVAVKRLCQGSALHRHYRHSRLAQQRKYPSQLFRQEYVPNGVVSVGVPEFRAHRLGHARKAKRLKIAIEKGKDLVRSGAFQNQLPAKRRSEQLERLSLGIG